MPDDPILDALILSDDIVLNKLDGKYSLVGIFKVILAPEFPFTHGACAVFGRLVDVWHDMHLYVSVNRPSAESEYGSAIAVQEMDVKGDKDRKAQSGVKEFGGRLAGLTFQKPGRHMIVVATADNVIGHANFEVVQIERAIKRA